MDPALGKCTKDKGDDGSFEGLGLTKEPVLLLILQGAPLQVCQGKFFVDLFPVGRVSRYPRCFDEKLWISTNLGCELPGGVVELW